MKKKTQKTKPKKIKKFIIKYHQLRFEYSRFNNLPNDIDTFLWNFDKNKWILYYEN